MGTPHNEAEKGEIAKRVLMPGDPLRAKYIAEHFLEDAVCFNTVRNMLGYTGTYKGEKISVMGGGMGVPSVGIYTYELYHETDNAKKAPKTADTANYALYLVTLLVAGAATVVTLMMRKRRK